MADKDQAQALDIDYGPVKAYQGQYWESHRGAESFMANPTEILSLDQIVENIFQVSRVKGKSFPSPIGTSSSSNDAFSRLAPEIVYRIFSQLDTTSICHLSVASRYIAHITSEPHFWKTRIDLDFGWISEVLDPKSKVTRETLDWRNVYRLLNSISTKNHPEEVRGLFNRRRIWNLCSEMLDKYYLQKEKLDRARNDLDHPEALDGAISSSMPRLTFPEARETVTGRIALFQAWKDLKEVKPIIETWWNDAGELSGLEVSHERDGERLESYRTLGDTRFFDDGETLPIYDYEWLTALVVTTRETDGKRKIVGLKSITPEYEKQVKEEEGDQRIFCAQPDHIIVGLQATWSNKGQITNLGILQQPISKAPADAHGRLSVQDLVLFGPEVTANLWMDELPPAGLSIVPEQHGYWAYDLKPDLAPMESLPFKDNNGSELENITAIAADVQFGGFQVHYKYADGSTGVRSIGPRCNAMRKLAIDGSGGERVICTYVRVGNIPNGLRFVTNRGRQLIIGQPTRSEQRIPASEEDILMGIYGYWSKRDTPKANLDSIGAFFTSLDPATSGSESSNQLTDSDGRFWDPSPPPGVIKESSPIYGKHELYNQWTRRTKHTPSDAAIVSWLDCSKPIESVKVTLCHGTKSTQFPLVSLRFRYTDSTQEAAVGPSIYLEPKDTQGSNGHHWCWCSLGDSRADEVQAGPHYKHDEWNVGGSRLEKLCFWIDDAKYWSGMQLVAEDGSESPSWGYCVGQVEEVSLVTAVEGQSKVLKFFIDNNGRSVTRDDYIAVAIQVLEMSTG